MYKAKYYKAPKPQTNPNRSSKPKPQWTTDFSDPDKYKLSEAEMIQRKAALQSKNRQTAKNDLEERRKKLQMGIIDEDTRKVYQTALQSKKIDLNPPIRKNLSQMIQQERQRKEEEKQRQEGEIEEENEGDEFEKEIKETQHFIKKLEKAKKQTKIEKAVDILLDEQKSTNFGPTKNQVLSSYEEEDEKNVTHEEALSNIEETIKFMEMKLFGDKKSQQPVSKKSPQKQKIKQFKVLQIHEEDEDNEFISATPRNQETFELSHLRMDIPIKQNEQEDECMSTIRRMREMIESKENLYSYENVCEDKNRFERVTSMKYSQSEPEVDFSLTMNNEEQEYQNKFIPKKTYIPKVEDKFQLSNQYEVVKKNLFDEVDKLQNYSSQDYDIVRPSPTPKYKEVEPQPVYMKKAVASKGLEELKSMVSTTKTKLENMKVEEISTGNNMMGFDFRGSINIKKNVLKK